jgi:deazaflavin-dependent oxidoreductase (nitroreductase family)
MIELNYEHGIKVAAKALSRTRIVVHRLTRGRIGQQWDGRDVAFITTTGRRTGRPHTTPLACIQHRDGVAVVASNGGSNRPPDWWLNLLRQPLAEIELAGTKRIVFARIADDKEQEPLADSFGQAYPRLERYRRRTRRFMPVVVLSAAIKSGASSSPTAPSAPRGPLALPASLLQGWPAVSTQGSLGEALTQR